MSKFSKIFVAGHTGMVGSAILRELAKQGEGNVIVATRKEVELTDQAAVHSFLIKEKPDQIYIAAAKVGGIYANNEYPADFLYENLMIQTNLIHGAFLAGVKKILFLGSSCIYPVKADQPMREEALLGGKLEPTNEPYAVAKIAGIKLCESYVRQFGGSHGLDFRSLMPTNLYGPGDNYHATNSHVIPGLIRRFHCAKDKNLSSVVVWGSGIQRREFLFVDDLARGAIFFMNLDRVKYKSQTAAMQGFVNIGSGDDMMISDLARLISEVVGYEGAIEFDTSKPDGPLLKAIDSSRMNALGWRATTDFRKGLQITYEDFLSRGINCLSVG